MNDKKNRVFGKPGYYLIKNQDGKYWFFCAVKPLDLELNGNPRGPFTTRDLAGEIAYRFNLPLV